MLPEISPQDFLKELIADKNLTILDVRAPIEFFDGSIPQSINLPILNNEQRALIGTCYKQSGREKAIELGYKLMEGAEKSARIEAWTHQIQHAARVYLTCFRGGLRSKITQAWLAEAGFPLPRIIGGTKALRQLFSDSLEKNFAPELILVSGKTGSGKSRLLQELQQKRKPVVDLEALAVHRGSAFGNIGPQPSQVDFENRLALQLLRLGGERAVVIEDESRMIGKRVMPERLFEKLRSSGVHLIEESVESRAELIFEEYILNGNMRANSVFLVQKRVEEMRGQLVSISKKLGGLQFSKIDALMKLSIEEQDIHKQKELCEEWIRRLLIHYYDPLYEKSLLQRNPKLHFKGNREELTQSLLKTLSTGR